MLQTDSQAAFNLFCSKMLTSRFHGSEPSMTQICKLVMWSAWECSDVVVRLANVRHFFSRTNCREPPSCLRWNHMAQVSNSLARSVIIFGQWGNMKSRLELARRYYNAHVLLRLQIPECSTCILACQSGQDVYCYLISISYLSILSVIFLFYFYIF